MSFNVSKVYRALIACADAQGVSFKYCEPEAYQGSGCRAIVRDEFLFWLDHHARGNTLNIYMFKQNTQITPSKRTSEDVLHVFGVVSGQPGWDETYGFLVDGPIRNYVEDLFRIALSYHDALKRREAEAEQRRKQTKEQKHAAKVAEFEKQLVKAHGPDIPANPQPSTPTEEPAAVQIYDVLCEADCPSWLPDNHSTLKLAEYLAEHNICVVFNGGKEHENK